MAVPQQPQRPRQPAPPQTPAQPQQPQTVRHSIGQPQRQPFNVPPPAQPIPGVRGTPPLPGGVPVIVQKPTESEAAMLKAAGWKPGQAVPSDMAQRLAGAQAQARQSMAEMPLPVAADTPPIEIPPETSLEQLPADKRAVIEASLAEAAEQLRAQQTANRMQPSHPGVMDAIAAAERPVSQPVIASPQQTILDDDRNQATYSDTGVPKETPTASGPVRPKQCPHCGWDQDLPDPIIPSEQDKTDFLTSILGNIPYEKVFDKLNGQLQITVRSLRPEELDMCYAQCYIERQQGLLQTENDFWEALTRNRAALQLVDIRSSQMLHEFPRSVQEWGPCPEGEDKHVKYIREEVYNTALRTETMARMALAAVADFNRLLSKLEANANNPDFWEATSSAT